MVFPKLETLECNYPNSIPGQLAILARNQEQIYGVLKIILTGMIVVGGKLKIRPNE